MDGSLKKLFAVLQSNLRANGYQLEESAFDRVSLLLNTKTRTFVAKIKERNGKRRNKKKAETWTKLTIYPAEISHSPYDIVNGLSQKVDHLNETVQEQMTELYEQMKEATRSSCRHKGKRFSEVSNRQQQRHLLQIQ